MTQYTTRVELHDATWDDYTKLHAEMKKRGFRQTITGDDGTIYELPPAEYDYNGTEAIEQVREKATHAARSVKNSFAVLVTQSSGRAWIGLKILKKAAA